jgi:hypothetical protein
VLAAFEVSDAEREPFRSFLDGLGYPWVEETGNVAFGLFLSGAPGAH